jgi:hypothetical protein
MSNRGRSLVACTRKVPYWPGNETFSKPHSPSSRRAIAHFGQMHQNTDENPRLVMATSKLNLWSTWFSLVHKTPARQ